MQYRPLGRTGLSVSLLSLGTMTFGEQNTEAEGHAQMDMAIEAGINLFDAAEMYPIPPKRETAGRTEEILGSWFASRPGAREKVVLATKVNGRSDMMTWLREPEQPVRVDAAQIVAAVEGCLRRLRTDRIDLYQVHWPARPMRQFGANGTVWHPTEDEDDSASFEDQLDALGRLVADGKVRAIGVSNESSWGVMRWLMAAEATGGPRIASIQNAYNLVNRTFETNLAETCTREDVSLLAYSALGQGYLTGKYRGGRLPAGARKTLFDRLQRYEGPGAVETIDAYLDLAAEAGLDPTEMAIAFAATRPFMTSVILGATSTEQLAACLAAGAITLADDLLEKIDALQRSRANPCP